MTEEETETIEKSHIKFAVGFFNAIWPFFEKKKLTKADKRDMINMAHASHHHWLQVGKPINDQRGEYMLAKVYTFLEMPSPALKHATRCLALTEEHGYKDFDLAYAYEIMARATALNNLDDEFEKYDQLAKDAGDKILKKGDRKMFLSDLKLAPWFGKK